MAKGKCWCVWFSYRGMWHLYAKFYPPWARDNAYEYIRPETMKPTSKFWTVLPAGRRPKGAQHGEDV